MYSEEDIKAVDWREHVIECQNMYFGSYGACPKVICSTISEGALILGAKSVQIEYVDNFWLVASEVDWLNVPSQMNVNGIDLFDKFVAFPEAGQNALRFECMAGLFSSTLATHSKGASVLIKGHENELVRFNKALEKLINFDRVIGFVFNSNILKNN